MTVTKEWNSIKKIFNDLLDLPSDKRFEELNALKQQNEVVYLEVKAMLEAEPTCPATPEPLTKTNVLVDPYKIVGTEFEGYQITELIASGSMGLLYKGHDKLLNRDVAIKLMMPNLSAEDGPRRRFLREAKLACNHDHPNIATIYLVKKSASGHDYIVMGFYEGRTLDKLIQENSIRIKDAIAYAQQIAEGLADIHSKHIYHCDIKPSNIMVQKSGRVVILDFGVAKSTAHDFTHSLSILGTLGYMSPETLSDNESDESPDIWALGIVMYEMITDINPFRRTSNEGMIRAICSERPAEIPAIIRGDAVPKPLRELIKCCLEKEKQYRPDSCHSIAGLLTEIASGKRPAITNEARKKRAQRNFTLKAIALVLTLLISFVSTNEEALYKIQSVIPAEYIPLPSEKFVIFEYSSSATEENVTAGVILNTFNHLKQLERSSQNFWTDLYVRQKDAIPNYHLDNPNKIGATLFLRTTLSRIDNTVTVHLKLGRIKDGRILRSAMVAQHADDLTDLSRQIFQQVINLLNLKFDSSSALWLKSTLSDNEDANNQYFNGHKYLLSSSSQKELEQAFEAFNSATEKNDTFTAAYASAGKVALRLYKTTKDLTWANKADSFLNSALKLDENEPNAYQTLGDLMVTTGKSGAAVGVFKLILSNDYNNTEALIGLGDAYYSMQKNKLAEQYFLKAIKSKPDYWYPVNKYGAFLMKTGRIAESEKQYERVITLNPYGSMGYSNMARVYWHHGDNDKTLAYFKKAIDREYSYATLLDLGTYYFYEQEYQKAIMQYEKALELNDQSYEAWSNLTWSYISLGLTEENCQDALQRAIELAEQKLHFNDEDVMTHSELATLYALNNQTSNALNEINYLLKQEISDINSMLGIAETYEILGDRKQAIAWLSRTMESGYGIEPIQNTYILTDLVNSSEFKEILKKLKLIDTNY